MRGIVIVRATGARIGPNLSSNLRKIAIIRRFGVPEVRGIAICRRRKDAHRQTKSRFGLPHCSLVC